MGDITHLFGGPLTIKQEHQEPPDVQLINTIINHGYTPPHEIIWDGQIHRFKSDNKKDKSGWYIAFPGLVHAGAFGCWRSGETIHWCQNLGRELSLTEQIEHSKRLDQLKAARENLREIEQNAAAKTAEQIWESLPPASDDHPYLKKKGVEAINIRQTDDGRLVVPVFDNDGTLCNLQFIYSDGKKLFLNNGKARSVYNLIDGDQKNAIFLCEGYSTACSIHNATNAKTVMAFHASNLPHIAKVIRDQYDGDIVIVADNDANGVGQKKAEEAAKLINCRSILIPIPGMDANDYAQNGYDLGELLNKKSEDWLISADEFCQQPAPLKWLIKGWIQEQALLMVHGISGGGKTFFVLDQCLRIASGKPDWMGHKVKSGSVIYLAGEGHHGLKSRIAAWKHYNNVDKLDMFLSKSGCDLNTPEGYLKVAQGIHSLNKSPDLIVVDTLHRFLLGDENSAQDAKTMLDACGGLMREFNCAVLLVHHTGVSEEAQHRARGSSAWRGALDIEISVMPPKEDSPMQIIQRKSKDAELQDPKLARLETVQIPGWFDEDGEGVCSAVLEEALDIFDDSEVEKYRNLKIIFNAIFDYEPEFVDANPYISKSLLKNHLIQNGRNNAEASRLLDPDNDNGLIRKLINSKSIQAYKDGWIVIDPVEKAIIHMRNK